MQCNLRRNKHYDIIGTHRIVARKATTAKKKATKGGARTKSSGKKAAKKKAARKTAAKKIKKTVKAAAKKAPRKVAKKVTKKTVKRAAKKAAKKVKKKAPSAPIKIKLPKSPLNKRELTEFHEMLLAKRRTLLGDMNGMEAEALRGSSNSGDQSSMPVHMADIGTDNYEQEFTLGLLESERQLLREIDEALERMALGTYGVCMGTGEHISKPRLQAKPWAKYSIAYVRKIEQGQVRVPALDYGQSADDEDDDSL